MDFSQTQMGEELRSHMQLVGGTWVMFSKVKGTRLLQMNVIVSTASQSSLFHQINSLFEDNEGSHDEEKGKRRLMFLPVIQIATTYYEQ